MGGAERQLVLLSRELVRRNNDIHVVTVFPGEHDAILAAGGATIHRLQAANKYDPLLLGRMIGLVRRLRPNVLNTWLTQMDILGGIAAKAVRVPWVLSERSARAAYESGILPSIRLRLGARADAVIANSPGGRDYWRSVTSGDRIHVIPNIVPRDEIEAADAIEDGVHPAEEVILYVGRFSEEKNLGRLIEALAVVLQARTATAVFCGDGPMRPLIEEKAHALGIRDRTVFTGTVTNVWSWMRRASLLVAVSVFEGDPNAVLEAVAAGTPIVVSDIAAHRALVDDSAAWFVDHESVQSIAGGVIAALADRQEAARRAGHARLFLTSRSADGIAQRYEEVYRSLRRRTA